MPREPSTTRQLLRLMAPHRRLGVAVVALGFLAALSEGVGIGLVIPFLERLDLVAALWIVAALLLKALFAFGAAVLFSRLSARAGHDLRLRVFDEVLHADLGRLNEAGRGRLLNVLGNESWRTADAMTLLAQLVVTAATMAVYVALLLLISWPVTLGVALAMLAMAAAVRYATRRAGDYGRRMTRANAEVARRMVEVVDGIEVVRGFGQEQAERGRFAAASEALRRVSERSGVLSGAVHPLYEVFAALVLIVVLLLTVRNPDDLARMLVFLFVLYRLAPVLKRFEQERVDLRAAEGAIRETAAVIEEQGEAGAAGGTVEFTGLREGIELDSVGFRYTPDATLALDNLSAEIPARGMVAITGPSGAGKSTLLRLLLRFTDPTGGRILVDGMPLQELSVASWRRHLGVVPQKPFLFSASVAENIAFGRPGATDEEIRAAAQAAGADGFIRGLRDGYATPLGEGGVGVSGGEAQRICLARALIRQPDLLLLDEATNALDAESERHVQAALERLKQDCAVVVIAHRAATIENADRVIELQPATAPR